MTNPANPTDTTATTPPSDPAANATTAPPETEPASTNSEAARYRVERNEARTERDALAERVAGYQRRDCEAVLTGILEVPGDLFDIGGATLSDFVDDDGNVLEDELKAAAAALIEQRPRLATAEHTARSQPSQWGQGGNGKTGTATGKSAWSDVIGKR